VTLPSPSVWLCGDRFNVVYRIEGTESAAREKALSICIEQTVEFPVHLVPAGDIRDQIVGHLETFGAASEGSYEAVISYAIETTGLELTQLLNVAYGNTSLQPGIRVERLEPCDSLLRQFQGPRFGRSGLRRLLGVPRRPILCTALKPMGLSCRMLAELAYQFALGGIDVIKDDHGLVDQSFAPFQERVERCAEAVARANAETGTQCVYVPNVTGPAAHVLDRARFARDCGAGGVLIAPGLAGFDIMRQLADDSELGLPVVCHPALLGSFVTRPREGISHYALFGQIMRLAGADAVIFPNYGGRFAFSRDDCLQIVAGATAAMGDIQASLPAAAGGIDLESIPNVLATYGREIMLLVGGGLHGWGVDIQEACREMHAMVDGLENE
jgi:ribulose-bisphosphate carboxylase large chain